MDLLDIYLTHNGAKYIGLAYHAKPRHKAKGVKVDYPIKVALVPINDAKQFFRRDTGQYRPDVSSNYQIDRLGKYENITLCWASEFETAYAVWKLYHKGNRGHFIEWIFVNILGAIDTAKTATGKCTTWVECGDVIYDGKSIQLKAWDASVAFTAIRNLAEKKQAI
jgi:hypothetical protein